MTGLHDETVEQVWHEAASQADIPELLLFLHKNEERGIKEDFKPSIRTVILINIIS